MLKKSIVFVLISIMILPCISGSFDHLIDEWYYVDDWEIEVCSRWGGLAQSQSHSGAWSTGIDELYAMAATLQGEKKVFDMGNSTVTLYDVAWYIQPIEGTEDYTIYLLYDGGGRKEIAKGYAPASSGDAGYYAEEAKEDTYESVLMVYDSGQLGVPIVRTR